MLRDKTQVHMLGDKTQVHIYVSSPCSELLAGSSSTCGTFGSPSLASKEEFKVGVLEVWQAVP